MPPKRKKAEKTSEIDIKKVKVEDSASLIGIKVEKSPEKKKKVRRSKRQPKPVKVVSLKIKEQKKEGIIYACSKCTKRYHFEQRYIDHLLNEHSELPGAVKCKDCVDVNCPNKEILAAHRAKYHKQTLFECPHCHRKFVRHAHVLRHLAQKGCDGRGVASFPCEICNCTFSRKDNLMVHLRMQHIKSKDFKCKQCPFSSGKLSKLIVHHQQKHLPQPLKLECDHCGKVTGSRPSMAKHLEIHGEKKYACDVCGYSTFTIEVMRRHVLTHVVEKPFKCAECHRSFIQRAQLDRHIDNRHTAKQCSHCNTAFATRAEVIIHEWTHSHPEDVSKSGGLRMCPIEGCNKKNFESVTALNTHVKRHLIDRPYSCEVCGRAYRTDVEMRRHMNGHTLERPRRCMYCVTARAYVRGEQLLRHVRKNHAQVFTDHLRHVRQVLNNNLSSERVKKSELDAILNVLDAEADRILQDYGEGVLYGGMQETEGAEEAPPPVALKAEPGPLMSEDELVQSLQRLLSHLIDHDLLECFGWPDETIDQVLEKVIEHCGAKPADPEKWTRVQCLRENSKHLFLHVVEDKNIAKMLVTHTIDQVIQNILKQIGNADDDVVDDGENANNVNIKITNAEIDNDDGEEDAYDDDGVEGGDDEENADIVNKIIRAEIVNAEFDTDDDDHGVEGGDVDEDDTGDVGDYVGDAIIDDGEIDGNFVIDDSVNVDEEEAKVMTVL